MAGKVLRAGCDAFALEARDERGNLPGDERRLRAEGANPDHGVLRIRVHICDRREIEIDPDGGELAGD